MERVAIDLEFYQELTGKIIGYAMQVHRVLGTGFQGVIYQRASAVAQYGIGARRELEMPLYYRQQEIGSRRVDFSVKETVLLELKALHEFTPTHHV